MMIIVFRPRSKFKLFAEVSLRMSWFAQQGSAWLAALRGAEWARLFGNWLTIIALSSLLVAVASCYGLQLRRVVAKLRAAGRVPGRGVGAVGKSPAVATAEGLA